MSGTTPVVRRIGSTSSNDNNNNDKNNNDIKKRKREWFQQQRPEFMDASAAVSACIFGARRLPELKRLYYNTPKSISTTSTKTIQVGDDGDGDNKNVNIAGVSAQQRNINTQFLVSGGGKTSSRHLRRRTTNLNSRKRHRFPTGGGGGNMTVPSSQINTHQEEVSSERGRDREESCPDLATDTKMIAVDNSIPGKKTRKAKRGNRSTLCAPHYKWHHVFNEEQLTNQVHQQHNDVSMDDKKMDISSDTHTTETENNNTNFQSTTTKKIPQSKQQQQQKSVQWMTTHLWHAKRFHMEDLWGWKVPSVHTNRGARAILRLTNPSTTQKKQQQQPQQEEKNLPKCWIQDVTWKSQPLVIRSHQLEILLATIRRLCPDVVVSPHHHHHQQQQQQSSSLNQLLCGATIGEGVMYEIDQFPRGAIGPATWRVVYTAKQSQEGKEEVERQRQHGETPMVGGIWEFHIWMHPSIRATVQTYLEDLAASQHSPEQLECLGTLPGGMSRLCLRGVHATETIRHALLVSSSSSSSSSSPPWHWDWDALFERDTESDSYQKTLLQLPHGAIFSVQVQLDDDTQQNESFTSTPQTTDNNNHIVVEQHISSVQTAIQKWEPTQSSKLPFQQHQQQQKCTFLPGTGTGSSHNNILLVWQRPRDPTDCPPNQAVCGWDILCSPNICVKLWHVLTTTSPSSSSSSSNYHACPIGLVEHAHLMMECHPPIPLFPRDYVDTRQGQLYWKGTGTSTTHDKKNPTIVNEWHKVRQLWEGGWGRIRISKAGTNARSRQTQSTELKPLYWNRLLWKDDTAVSDDGTHNDDIDESDGEENEDQVVTDDALDQKDEADAAVEEMHVVVVRGVFGQPFCDALAGCGSMAPPTKPPSLELTKSPKKRRKHRRVRPFTEITYAMPLSKDQGNQFTVMCRSLHQSLTLPAVLFCHIQLIGPGKILPGSQLFAGVVNNNATAGKNGRTSNNNNDTPDDDKNETFLIGMATSGSFSNSRGLCHGVGILGAARLLQALEYSASDDAITTKKKKKFAAIARQEPGTNPVVKEIQLLVTLQNGMPGTMMQRSAMISLIL